MPAISLSSLKKLFGRKPPKQPSFDSLHGFFPRPPGFATSNGSASAVPPELKTKKSPQVIAEQEKPTFEDSMAEFNQADHDKREHIIDLHPIWSSEELLTHLDVQTLKHVIDHINTQASAYGHGYDHESSMHWESVEEYIHRGKTGLEWSLPKKFAEFQVHALEHTNEDAKKELIPLISNVLLSTKDYQNHAGPWLLNAEHFLAHGGQLPWPALASALYRNAVRTYNNNSTPLNQLPLVIDFFNTQADDAQLVAWATSNVENQSNSCTPPQWLFKTHPQADIWRLGDDPKLVSLLPALSESLRDGALFKAWHGIELEPEEVIKFPLAQSLYVHKYAPIYREGVMPLPTNWEVALSLAQTGDQFKSMAIQAYEAQKHKMEPTALALPELN